MHSAPIRSHSDDRRGFTLIELLVVIAIIAILAVVVVLTLNPAELLRQSRDANRVSDMATLTSALNLYLTDQGGGSGFSLGNASNTGISVPDRITHLPVEVWDFLLSIPLRDSNGIVDHLLQAEISIPKVGSPSISPVSPQALPSVLFR